MNDGLKRRFTFKYHIEGYSADELMKIFEIKLKADKWSLKFKDFDASKEDKSENKSEEEKEYESFFKRNHKNFPNFGGDIETLFLKCKIAHSKRVVFEAEEERRILTMGDIEKGFKEFLSGRKSNADKKLGLYQ
jgi:hypothetical protein